MAAAVMTPSGAPPDPITACTPVPITAAAIPAERSPSPINFIRAPASRMSEISFSRRGRSSTTTTSSSTSGSIRKLSSYFFADIEHRRLIAFAFADHDCPSHGYVVHGAAHSLRGHVVGEPAVAFAHGSGGSNGGRLHYTKKSGSEIAFNIFA